MDIEVLFPCISSLPMFKWKKWTKLFTVFSVIQFFGLTRRKIQFVCHATSLYKILITGFAIVLPVTP